MSMLKRLLVAGLSLVGFQANQARAVAQPHEIAARESVAKNGATTREIKEDHFGGFRDGIKRQWMRDGGRSPYSWGISKECAKMVRKNKLRAAGVRESRR